MWAIWASIISTSYRVCPRCEDLHRKRWMFVWLLGLGGTITIALFIKYLLGFIMREMGDCFVFIFLTFTFFFVFGFQLGVSYVPKEFSWCWYQDNVWIMDKQHKLSSEDVNNIFIKYHNVKICYFYCCMYLNEIKWPLLLPMLKQKCYNRLTLYIHVIVSIYKQCTFWSM